MTDGFKARTAQDASLVDVLDGLTKAIEDDRFKDVRFNCAKDTLASLGKVYGICAHDIAEIGGTLSITPAEVLGRYGNLKYSYVVMETMDVASTIEEVFGDVAAQSLALTLLEDESVRAPQFIALQSVCTKARVIAFEEITILATFMKGIAQDYPDVEFIRQLYIEKADRMIAMAEQLFPLEALAAGDANPIWKNGALFGAKKG